MAFLWSLRPDLFAGRHCVSLCAYLPVPLVSKFMLLRILDLWQWWLAHGYFQGFHKVFVQTHFHNLKLKGQRLNSTANRQSFISAPLSASGCICGNALGAWSRACLAGGPDSNRQLDGIFHNNLRFIARRKATEQPTPFPL